MLRRQYAKYCDIADFADPHMAALIAEVFPAHPADRPHRKAWEYAMAAAYLEDAGLLDGTARILDVGAGTDAILYWLATRAAKVVAVDLYGEGRFAGREATARMLEAPASFAPAAYPEDRLDVRHMDGRALAFDDGSFDAVVSLSSIEHFGSRRDIRAAAHEIGRVLRPGGRALVVTEGFVRMSLKDRAPVQFAARVVTGGRRCASATPRWRATEVFTWREIVRDIVGPSGLVLAQPLDPTISPASFSNVHVVQRDGTSVPTGGTSLPHVMLGVDGSRFTSVAVPLVKPGAGGAATTPATGRPNP